MSKRFTIYSDPSLLVEGETLEKFPHALAMHMRVYGKWTKSLFYKTLEVLDGTKSYLKDHTTFKEVWACGEPTDKFDRFVRSFGFELIHTQEAPKQFCVYSQGV